MPRSSREERFQAGGWEVAASSVIEDAPATAAEVDKLERLAADSDPTDEKVAQLVVAQRRKPLASR